METITLESWPLGWIPSDDSIGGRPEGLLRMDNLAFDKVGKIGLTQGTRKVSNGPITDGSTKLYSRYIGGEKLRYSFSNGNVYRNYGGANDEEIYDNGVLSGGNASACAFHTAFGHVLMCSGDQKRKDDGTTQSNLGLIATVDPGVEVQNPPNLVMDGSAAGTFSDWANVENGSVFDGSGAYLEIDSDATTFRAIAERPYLIGTPLDGTSFTFPLSRQHTPDDIYTISIRIGDTSNFVKLRIEYILDANYSAWPSTYDNYFYFEWDVGHFNPGINSWSRVTCKRSDFFRVGTSGEYDWNTIKAIKISFIGTTAQTYVMNTAYFSGGITGPLRGDYKYCQVNVIDNGHYLEKSPKGTETATYTVINGTTEITPAALVGATNQVWIYRTGGTMDGWYRVKQLTEDISDPFTDNVSDEDAMLENEKLDFFLTNLPDQIISIAGPFRGRVLYLANDGLYVSLESNPSSYDSRYKYEFAGSQAEIGLFVTIISENEALVGTTKDIYVFRFAGDIGIPAAEFALTPLGIKQPPINSEYGVEGQTLYYFASDGIRSLAGSSSSVISEPLDLFFKGFECHGLQPVRSVSNNGNVLAMCYSRGLFIFSLEHFGPTGRVLHVYDTVRRYWRVAYFGIANFSPLSLFTEEDGTILCGTVSGTDGYLRELFYGTTWDEGTSLPVVFRTVFDNFRTPFNRKDPFTLKIRANTGNVAATIKIYADGSTTPVTLTATAWNGIQEKDFKLMGNVATAKSYQIEISGNFSVFDLYQIEILYELRPTQANKIKIQNSNLGTVKRKRFLSYPLVIDSLGNDVTFTPLVDNSAQSPATINNSEKDTYHHFFTSETVGTDIGGTLEAVSGYFEFYGSAINEAVSEVLPAPARLLIIPNEDFGTYARKQFDNIPFTINTRGQNVTITPILDGVIGTSQTFNTNTKQTVSYFFTSYVTATNVSLYIEASSSTPFEFYTILKPERMRVLPNPTKNLIIPATNFGVAQKKRVRVLPFKLNSFGSNVTFTPSVDGTDKTSSIHNTSSELTVFHYFTEPEDIIGVDFGGSLSSLNVFEFFELLQPDTVEVIPVGRLHDQLGPFDFERNGRARLLILNLLATGTSISYRILVNDVSKYESSFTTTANVQRTYNIQMPNGIHPNVLRIELWSTAPFHRFNAQLRVDISGNDTDFRLVRFK